MSQTMASIIIPIKDRHIPYRLENGDVIIQDNIILLIDQLDSTICACENTTENLVLLGIVPISSTESSVSSIISDSESQFIDSSKITHKSGTKWSRDATLFLIDQWQKNSSKFACTTIRNEEVWKNIVKELEDAGFSGYTWKQAEDKWKNIRKGYMKVKDNQGPKSSGAARVTCKFYEEMDNIFRSSPSVEPISVVSSLNPKNLPATDDSDSDKNGSIHQFKKKKTKLQRDTLTWLSSFKDDANAKEAACEKRHQQTLNTLNRAIDSFESQMQKLIDKL